MKNDSLLVRILEGCKKNDIRAQEHLYKRFYGYVMAVCLRYTGSKECAEEVLNDCFYKAFKYIKTYKALVPFEFWLKKIAVNTSIDYYRRNSKNTSLMVLTDQKPEDKVEDEPNLSFEDIMFLINKLSDNYRVTFMLHEIDGYKHKEIAESLNITEATSRSNLKRAKEKLKELYYQHFKESYEKQVR